MTLRNRSEKRESRQIYRQAETGLSEREISFYSQRNTVKKIPSQSLWAVTVYPFCRCDKSRHAAYPEACPAIDGDRGGAIYRVILASYGRLWRRFGWGLNHSHSIVINQVKIIDLAGFFLVWRTGSRPAGRQKLTVLILMGKLHENFLCSFGSYRDRSLLDTHFRRLAWVSPRPKKVPSRSS